MKLTIPPRGNDSGLSDAAKVILRHFRDNQIPQLAYEYPATVANLFSDPEECERAQSELHNLGLVDLGPELPRHIPVVNRVRATAITLDGERFIARGNLDD